mgnify:CR=1 FL=1
MAITYKQFVQNLDDLGIMTADEVRAIWEDGVEPDPQKLAVKLVRAGTLTKYQAIRVYQNKHHGLLLGNYLILDRIGRGGMGEVFKARHRRMKRLVAVKVLSQKVTQSDQSRRRFQREVEAAGKLDHANIVTYYDADKHKGIDFLVMEFVDGKDLAALLKQKDEPFSVAESLDCIIQAARGLQFAHESGVVHRDIKPQNMLLDSNGCIKILDMGLVSLEDTEDQDSADDLTEHNQIMGSIDYMSPEQAEDIKNVDARTDIYSLGCTLFRLLTRTMPYQGDKLVHKLVAHRQHPIPSLRDFRDDVSPQLDQVFQKMLAKGREDRQDSMATVISELEVCQKLDRAKSQQSQAASMSNTCESDVLEFAGAVAYGQGEDSDADSAMFRFVQSIEVETTNESNLDDDGSIAAEPIDDVVTTGTSSQESKLGGAVEGTVQRLGDSETMPELQVRQDGPSELSRQWKGDKRTILLQVLAGVFIVTLTVFAWFLTRQPQLVIHWPVAERSGVMVLLNGKLLEKIPGTDPVRISVERGTHQLEFRRRGYEWIEQEISVGRGERVVVKLPWIEDITPAGGLSPGEPPPTP